MNIGTWSDSYALFLRFQSLMPRNQVISAGRDIAKSKTSGTIRNGEIRVIKYQDDGTHVGMDMAEDLYDPRPVESNRSNLVFRIAAQVKAPRTGKGKNVVEERVTVWEIDCGSGPEGKHVRYEGFIDLPNGWVLFG